MLTKEEILELLQQLLDANEESLQPLHPSDHEFVEDQEYHGMCTHCGWVGPNEYVLRKAYEKNIAYIRETMERIRNNEDIDVDIYVEFLECADAADSAPVIHPNFPRLVAN